MNVVGEIGKARKCNECGGQNIVFLYATVNNL